MAAHSKRSSTILLFMISLFLSQWINAQGIALEPVQKDSVYSVRILYNGNVLAVDEAPFSIFLSNTDGSATAKLLASKANINQVSPKEIHLISKVFIPELTMDLFAETIYKLVNENVVRKTVRLFQPSMPKVKYILEEKTSPAAAPKQFVTFEENNFPGGWIHEMFPAMGFISGKYVVGVLTDAGYKNQYTRNTRRRYSENGGGFVGMRKLADVSLFSIADSVENREGHYFLKQTYGEYYDLDNARDSSISISDHLQPKGELQVTVKGVLFLFQVKRQDGQVWKGLFIFPVKMCILFLSRQEAIHRWF